MKVWIDGAVVEGSQARIPVTDHGFLYGDGALEGLTRATVLELARQQGVPVEERSLGRFDLLAAEEVFLTGTGAGIVAVGSLDGIGIGKGGSGPITRRICRAFEQYARSTGTPI